MFTVPNACPLRRLAAAARIASGKARYNSTRRSALLHRAAFFISLVACRLVTRIEPWHIRFRTDRELSVLSGEEFVFGRTFACGCRVAGLAWLGGKYRCASLEASVSMTHGARILPAVSPWWRDDGH